MNTITIPRPERPADLFRRLVGAGLVLGALVVALSADVMQFEASKECRGAFSSGFGGGFDVRRCDVVIRWFGRDIGLHFPLPR
jgi:hypothetical protein